MAPPKESSIRWTTIASWLLGAPAGLAVLYWLFFHGHSPESSGEEAAKETETRKDTVNFPKERWEASGIALEETKAAPFVERHWRPGRLAVDESRGVEGSFHNVIPPLSSKSEKSVNVPPMSTPRTYCMMPSLVSSRAGRYRTRPLCALVGCRRPHRASTSGSVVALCK